MNTPSNRGLSLRVQLLLFGLAATVLPIFALLSVVFATSTSEEIIEGPAGEQLIGESSSGDVPPIVVVAAIGLALAATVAVWLWSARAVRPMKDITALADEIQAGSLDRRLGLDGVTGEVQQLGDSFDRMLDRLESASRTQQQLIEDTSHELRTPLAALAVNNEVLRNHPDPTDVEYEAFLDRSDALVERLQLTIDDLLKGARARARRASQIDNDLMEIAHRVADHHRRVSPECRIVVTGPDELRLAIDGPSVERALANLVENAARHSPTGEPIAVDVRVGDSVTLAVTDHGPGIAPEDLPRVFDRYFRADEGGGHGIGLALVKQVADAHGSIHVESPVPGRPDGSTFELRFD